MNKTKVVIESNKNFAVTICNFYSTKLIAIPGSNQRMKVQDPADVDRFTFKVNRIDVPVGEKFREFVYTATVREVANRFFVEDPYDSETKDPNKAMNSHFKQFGYGDTVPVEYMIWRFVYSYKQQIINGDITIVVDDSNYPVVQWLFQAIYNDMGSKYNKLPEGFLAHLHTRLKGRKDMVTMPTERIDSTVGIYNALVANKESFIADLNKLESQLAEKRKFLDSIDAVVLPESENVVEPGATEFSVPRKGKVKKEESVVVHD